MCDIFDATVRDVHVVINNISGQIRKCVSACSGDKYEEGRYSKQRLQVMCCEYVMENIHVISILPAGAQPVQRRKAVRSSYVLWIAITLILILTILRVYFVSPLCSRNTATVISALHASTAVCSAGGHL